MRLAGVPVFRSYVAFTGVDPWSVNRSIGSSKVTHECRVASHPDTAGQGIDGSANAPTAMPT
jgi:hypothetical protein